MSKRAAVTKIVDHQGLSVHVDRPAGTSWTGTGPDGESYSVTQQGDYGYLRHVDGTKILGDDGEDYDAYVGPSTRAANVHVVTQLTAKSSKASASDRYDEQKAMLGYDSAEEAEAVYRAHVHASMFGGLASMSLDDFKAQLEAHKASGTRAPFRARGLAVATTTDAHTTAQPTETKEMPHASPLLTAAGSSVVAAASAGAPAAQPAAPATPGGAGPGPRGLCVRAAVLSAVRAAEREADFVCSTDVQDSYGEIVRQNWRLERFEKNPVALWSHDSHALPVGQWIKVRVENDALRGTLKVATAAANPFAEHVLQSIVEGSLRAVSVGFLPGKVSYEDGKDGGEQVCVLDDNELFEISPTPLPANPDALVEMKTKAYAAYRAAKKTVTPLRVRGVTTKEAPVPTNKAKKDMVTCPKCGASFDPEDDDDDDDDEKAKAAKAHSRLVMLAHLAPFVAERAAALVKRTELEATVATLGKELVSAQLVPLSGLKYPPAAHDGHVDLAMFYLGQGAAGATKWEKHLAGLRAGPDLTILAGPVLPKDMTPSGLATASSAAAGEDELSAIVNAEAQRTG
jgi:HK97 family phage prohead protease